MTDITYIRLLQERCIFHRFRYNITQTLKLNEKKYDFLEGCHTFAGGEEGGESTVLMNCSIILRGTAELLCNNKISFAI